MYKFFVFVIIFIFIEITFPFLNGKVICAPAPKYKPDTLDLYSIKGNWRGNYDNIYDVYKTWHICNDQFLVEEFFGYSNNIIYDIKNNIIICFVVPSSEANLHSPLQSKHLVIEYFDSKKGHIKGYFVYITYIIRDSILCPLEHRKTYFSMERQPQ